MRELATLDRSPTLRRSASVLLVLLVASLVLLLAPSPAHAATGPCVADAATGCINGTIRTSAGQPAVGVTLTVEGGGATVTVTTDAEGKWTAPVTAAGDYTVTARPGDAARRRDAAEPGGQPAHGHGHARARPAARCSPSGSRPPRAAAPGRARRRRRRGRRRDRRRDGCADRLVHRGRLQLVAARAADRQRARLRHPAGARVGRPVADLRHHRPEQLRARRAGHARRDPRLHRRADASACRCSSPASLAVIAGAAQRLDPGRRHLAPAAPAARRAPRSR